MSAMPIISTVVSGMGVISTINQQRRAAELQASAIDDERTNAVIQSELAAAQQRQQYLIASTQQKLEAKNAQINADLLSRQAELTRLEYDSQLENVRTNLDLARLQQQQEAVKARGDVKQQRLRSDEAVLQQQAETTSTIRKAQESVATIPEGELDFASQVALTNRLNRLGLSTKAQQATFAENQRKRAADVDELELDKQAIDRYSNTALGYNAEIDRLLQEQIDLEEQAKAQATETAKAQLERDRSTADRTLSEYQNAIRTALDAGMSDAELQRFLLEQSNQASKRANELSLNAQLVSLDNQAKSIQRPGLFDLLSGGLSVFNTYQNMMESQRRTQEANQRAAQITKNASSTTQPPINPFYKPDTQPLSLPTPTEGLVIPTGTPNPVVSKTVGFVNPKASQADFNASTNYWRSKLNIPSLLRR